MIWILTSMILLLGMSSSATPALRDIVVQDTNWTAREFLKPEALRMVAPSSGEGELTPPDSPGNSMVSQGLVFKDLGGITVSGNYWTLIIESKTNLYHKNLRTLGISLRKYKRTKVRCCSKGLGEKKICV